MESARKALAYNLSVKGIHSYHVGHAAVLVHNTCPLIAGPAVSGVNVLSSFRRLPGWRQREDGQEGHVGR